MKRFLSVLLAALLLSIFTGCQAKDSSSRSEPSTPLPPAKMSGTLKVLTEATSWADTPSMIRFDKSSCVRTQLNRIAKYFMLQYPDMTVDIEYLTMDEDTRENEIQQLRVALMAGDVPDVYLLPTLDLNQIYVYELEPLFRDVNQAIGNGWFRDISSLYDADKDLHTEELHPTIMDAGRVGEARYILPLRYSAPFLLVDTEALEASSLNAEAVRSGVAQQVEEAVLHSGIPSYAQGFDSFSVWPLDLFPRFCDYETEEARLDPKALSQLLTNDCVLQNMRIAAYKELAKSKKAGYGIGLTQYYSEPSIEFCVGESRPLYVITIEWLFDLVPVAKAMGREVEIIPLRASDGSYHAQIAYWGAVSSACENPGAAYEFLRLFLTPEAQHGGELGEFDVTLPVSTGWPVRYMGYAEKEWARRRDEIMRYVGSGDKERQMQLAAIQLTDEDLPLLAEPIDHARFTCSLDEELYDIAYSFRHSESEITEAEAQKAANDFVRDLKYHLAEG